MGRWAVRDRRYKRGYRWTPEAYRAFYKWTAIFTGWCSVVIFNPSGLADLLVSALIAWYATWRIRMNWRIGHPPAITGRSPPPELSDRGTAALPEPAAPVGQRNSRAIPQNVKIKVATRDQGRCRQCGSSEDLHFDHIIPWSRGGANTVANIQLLCGRCNRRKGADNIPMR